ncbi:hypothetical protein SLS54_004506 [Diplodia seriata]
MGVQGPLPDNQWQIELEHWHNISMAYFQESVISLATGPSRPGALRYLIPPNGTEQQNLCKNQASIPLLFPLQAGFSAIRHPLTSPPSPEQKVYSRAHFNFSVFWLAFTLVLGTTIIILSYTLETLVCYLQRRFRRDTYARLEWATNDTLQLQRLANEELGIGVWTGCCDAVPVTTNASEHLAVLDASDPDHPRLKAPVRTFDELLAAAGAPPVAGEGHAEGDQGRREGDDGGEEETAGTSGMGSETAVVSKSDQSNSDDDDRATRAHKER